MTRLANSKGALILVIGDLIAYLFSLVISLAIRYQTIPSRSLMALHLPSFSILFVLFLLVSFSAGMYDMHASLIRGKKTSLLLRVQIINIMIGIAFFYFAPVTIAPKANLFIFFIVSTAALLIWRMVMFPVVSMARKEAAIVVGGGTDIQDLLSEVNDNGHYGLIFKGSVTPRPTVQETVAVIGDKVRETGARIIVADLHNPAIESAMPFLYSLIFSGVQIVDASKLYETIFGRVPISLIRERWLVENSSSALGSRRVYDVLKRGMDIAISLIGVVFTFVVFYPIAWVLIKLDDGGPMFSYQDRVGQNGKIVRIMKFRTMSIADDGGKWGSKKNTVTRAGAFLRKSRIDEFTQFWNVLKGDVSLIGPRPEFPDPVATYGREIPYYDVRHIIKPGLSGWAQIYGLHPHHGIGVDETRNKLSYDLYYIKNRSFMLDLKIALHTLQVLLSFAGR